MALKLSTSKLNTSLLQTEVTPLTTKLDTIKNPSNLDTMDKQQQAYKVVTELATHYVNVADNNQYEIQKPIPTQIDKSVIETIESSNFKTDLDSKIAASSQIVNAINDSVNVTRPVILNDNPNLIKIIDNNPVINRAVINAFLNDTQPVNIDVHIDEATTISTTSTSLEDIQTIETVSPKVLVAMQAKALLNNNQETHASKQLDAYFTYHSLKVDIFSKFILKVSRDPNVRNLLTQVGAQKLEARSRLDSINRTLTIFSSIENEINSMFYMLGKDVTLGSPRLLSSRGISESSRERIQQYINSHIESNIKLEQLANDVGFTNLKGSTQGLFIILQTLKNSVVYHTNKLSSTRVSNLNDDTTIPALNYTTSQFQLDLPNDFTFESRLNGQLTLIDVNSTITTIAETYDSYIKNFPSDVDTQIAILLELATKESRISSGINNNFSELSQKLSFTFIPGKENINALNTLFGYIPNEVTNIPNQVSQLSIASYLQYKPVGTTSVILPFEVSFLTKNNQTFNPINEYLYYRDLPLLDKQNTNFFPTLSDFSNKFSTFTKNVESSILKLGLIPYESENEINSNYDNFHSLDFFNKLDAKLNGPVKSDPVATIFSAAATNSTLRAILFYRCAFSFAGLRRVSTRFAYANQVNATNILRDALKNINVNATNLPTTRVVAPTPLPIDQIIAAFDEGTGIVGDVLDLVSSAGLEYKLRNVFLGNRTSFTSVDEIIIMMSLFHAVVLYINKFTNQNITSVDTNNNILYVRKNISSQRFTANSILIREKLTENSTIYIKQFYYLLQTLSSISQRIAVISTLTKSSQFVSQVDFIKQSLPANGLMKSVTQSQSIRNIKFTIAQMQETVLPGTTISTEPNLQFFDPFVIDQNQYMIVKEYAKNITDSSRILTIGIPLGTQRKLQVKSKQSNDPDVIKVKVHKIDQLNQNVVYKPIEFLFEMSRYTPYSKEKFKNISSMLFTNVLELIPIFDISSAIEGHYDYVGSNLNESRYDFLSNDQKNRLLENHAKSWCLSQYLRFFSGLNVSEQSFLSTPLTAKSMSPDILNAFFNSLPFANSSSSSRLFGADLGRNQVSVAYATEHYTVVNELSRTTHIFSTADHYVQKAITPSSFDRIFSIIFKDNDFEIESGVETHSANESKFFTFYAEIESLGEA